MRVKEGGRGRAREWERDSERRGGRDRERGRKGGGKLREWEREKGREI